MMLNEPVVGLLLFFITFTVLCMFAFRFAKTMFTKIDPFENPKDDAYYRDLTLIYNDLQDVKKTLSNVETELSVVQDELDLAKEQIKMLNKIVNITNLNSGNQ